jgi:hypothetical protein
LHDLGTTCFPACRRVLHTRSRGLLARRRYCDVADFSGAFSPGFSAGFSAAGFSAAGFAAAGFAGAFFFTIPPTFFGASTMIS